MSKTLIAIGDSITHGTYVDKTDSGLKQFVAFPNFADLIKDAFHYDVLLNCGVNGVSISSTSDVNSDLAICKRIQTMPDADTAIVAGGTNDYATNVAIGSPYDKTDISFYGALDVLFNALKAKYKKVYVITPIRRLQDGTNNVGYVFEDYRNAINEKAKEYQISVIDGFKVPIDPKNEEDRNKYIFDGLHPNKEGHKLYAEYVIKKIREYENGDI